MNGFVSLLAVVGLVGGTVFAAPSASLSAQGHARYAPLGPAGIDLGVPAGVVSPVEEADLLYFEGDALASLELLKAPLAAVPDDYDVLWRAARAAVILGVAEEGSRPQNRWLDPAMELGDRAVAVRADGIDGLYWRGAAHGRRAMNASPGYATELAQQVWDDAHAILALEPMHGGAHNLLGKLGYEVMSLSRFERAVGRIFMGNEALSSANWELAEAHLEEAASAWPDLVLFQFDLAELHRKRGRKREAVEAYRRALALPAVHPPDIDLQEQARAYVRELGS
jgi:tetratricopeptide (TPR) repeat protein